MISLPYLNKKNIFQEWELCYLCHLASILFHIAAENIFIIKKQQPFLYYENDR